MPTGGPSHTGTRSNIRACIVFDIGCSSHQELDIRWGLVQGAHDRSTLQSCCENERQCQAALPSGKLKRISKESLDYSLSLVGGVAPKRKKEENLTKK